MVYRGTQLLWTAKAETVPIELAVLKLDGLEGVILALDERGHLSLNYLGTQPNMELPLFSTVRSRGGMGRSHAVVTAAIFQHSAAF